MASDIPQIPTQEELASLSREAQVAYAARCALRVFPLIGSGEYFDSWGDYSKFSVETTWAAALLAAIRSGDYSSTMFSYASFMSGRSVSTSCTSSAFYAYYASYAYTFSDASSAYYANCSSSVVFDSIDSPHISWAARNDFDFLSEYRDTENIESLFFQRPLFEGSPYFYIGAFWNSIEKAFKSINCMALLDTWKHFSEGNPLSEEEIGRWLVGWFKRYHSPGITSSVSDVPAGIDRLGRNRLINPLAAMLSLPEQKTPLTIGLFGHWGSGKSTVMKLLQKKLSDNRKLKRKDKQEFLFSWFNCWEYEQTENITAGLAQEIVRGLLTDGSYQNDQRSHTKEVNCFRKFWIRIQYLFEKENRAKTLWLVTKALLVGILAICAAIPFLLNQESISGLCFVVWLREIGNNEILQYAKLFGGGVLFFVGWLAWHLLKQASVLINHPLTVEMATFFKLPCYQAELGQIPVIRRQLESLCRVCLYRGKKQIRRLLVFVDDLDRCGPESIAKTFDAIRLITHIPGIVVMVGVDERVAFKAMGEAYKDYAQPRVGRLREDVARDYLGKIIQVPIRLNPSSDEELRPYINEVLFPVDSRRREEPAPTEPPGNKDDVAGQGSKSSRESRETPANDPEDKGLPNDNPLEPSSSDRGSKDPEQDRATENELIESMKETDEEVEAFSTLTKIFEFTNPRQLLRLRNSYRLLKGIFPSKLMREFIDDASKPDWEYTLMLMLFGLEFRTESPPDQIRRWLEKGGLKTTDTNDDPKAKLRDQFYEADWEQATDYLFGKDEPLLQRLEDFTMTCVLPYPKKETVLKNKDSEAEARA